MDIMNKMKDVPYETVQRININAAVWFQEKVDTTAYPDYLSKVSPVLSCCPVALSLYHHATCHPVTCLDCRAACAGAPPYGLRHYPQ